ncbi:Glyoxalase/bleomycin resistance protein/dioxygenase [Candidatus Koribacter versatilis Ellin345]|uniref:Glyoxalase/bleomycin resistance protein/dioxygenase n=2 Tax=Candidatus Korobacter versatilis TaxID=658062 RepID=Q1IU81_KORVE|nr:Glyoxalase/bleomycin resistance protein/dioxygenase [Candidatus Koribacter versatilis Ellin345]
MSAEFYPMPMFVRLAVADVEASKQWFHTVLEFESVFDIPHSMAHLRGRRYQDVLIVKGEVPEQVGQGVTLSFSWKEPVDEIVPRLKAAGGKIVDGPVDRPWNARELVIEDPNGYRMSFSRQLANKEFGEVMSGVEADK